MVHWASQNREDQYVYRTFFAGRTSGVYFEAGAMDGVKKSNTLAFSQMGWHGVLVEPTPSKLAQNRPKDQCFQCALGPTGEITMIIYDNFPQLSEVKGVEGCCCCVARWAKPFLHKHEIQVPVRPVSELTRGLPYIDFFSLDVEGYEEVVLQTVDWDIRVGVWLIEMHQPEPAIAALFAKHGYTYHSRIGLNDVYVDAAYVNMPPAVLPARFPLVPFLLLLSLAIVAAVVAVVTRRLKREK